MTTNKDEWIAIVDGTYDSEDESVNPFGKRWGHDAFTLSAEHLEALQAGKTLAFDVLNEYVAFIRMEREKKL